MTSPEYLEKTDGLALNRRKFLGYFSAAGLGSTLLPGALLAVAQDAPQVTTEMVAAAAKIAGVPLSEEAQKRAAEGLNRQDGLLKNFQSLREMNLGNDTPSALVFNPILPGVRHPAGESYLRTSKIKVTVPKTDEDLAFLPVTHLAYLLKKRDIKSVDLAKICLERLKKYDPILKCVVTLTEDLALNQ
ncbi:MAG TPA: amidase, partial [Acidobacteriota bacterium]